jgi:hypothetical protein
VCKYKIITEFTETMLKFEILSINMNKTRTIKNREQNPNLTYKQKFNELNNINSNNTSNANLNNRNSPNPNSNNTNPNNTNPNNTNANNTNQNNSNNTNQNNSYDRNANNSNLNNTDNKNPNNKNPNTNSNQNYNNKNPNNSYNQNATNTHNQNYHNSDNKIPNNTYNKNKDNAYNRDPNKQNPNNSYNINPNNKNDANPNNREHIQHNPNNLNNNYNKYPRENQQNTNNPDNRDTQFPKKHYPNNTYNKYPIKNQEQNPNWSSNNKPNQQFINRQGNHPNINPNSNQPRTYINRNQVNNNTSNEQKFMGHQNNVYSPNSSPIMNNKEFVSNVFDPSGKAMTNASNRNNQWPQNNTGNNKKKIQYNPFRDHIPKNNQKHKGKNPYQKDPLDVQFNYYANINKKLTKDLNKLDSPYKEILEMANKKPLKRKDNLSGNKLLFSQGKKKNYLGFPEKKTKKNPFLNKKVYQDKIFVKGKEPKYDIAAKKKDKTTKKDIEDFKQLMEGLKDEIVPPSVKKH